MSFARSKKGAALLIALVLAVGAGVSAYGYYSGNGTGDGSASAATALGNVNITLGVGMHAGIVPGGAVPVDFSAANAGPTEGIVHSISFVSVTDPTDTSPGNACSAYLTTYGTGGSSDFSMAMVTETSPGTLVPPTGSSVALGSGTLVWANNASQDQTVCSGQNLRLNVAWN